MTVEETSTTPELGTDILRGVIDSLLRELRDGAGDRDRRRQVEEWMRALADKYPRYDIEAGLRDYYFAEAQRLHADFAAATELADKLALGRSIELMLEKANDFSRRASEKR